MSVLSQPHFHNEAAAIAQLKLIVWPRAFLSALWWLRSYYAG